ncbi:KAP family NTPase [Kribbella sp. NBC_01505]|uniref:KAP family NTPase n=1 Tax=Kribbella sp. NBC_01505 TaxID=2903580 RepID=UPI0038646855
MVSRSWSDDPIESRADDAFDRAGYADRAADLIATSHSSASSTVFGLSGPWGSGKSSMVAMITESLEQRYAGWKVVRFTPWATSDVAGLLSEFYSTLIQPLPRRRKVGRKSRSALARLAQISAPAASAIPGAGKPIGETLKTTGQWLAEPTPWDKAFAKATKGLRKLGIPVLVVADDIDRLDPTELSALFRVVRLLGRFPGVNYLLAYDERTLARSFSSGNQTDSRATFERFIEKIVQYPLVVPPLMQTQILHRLDDGIQEVLQETKRDGIDWDRLSRVGDLFPTHLWTPRGVDRFVAQVRHHLPMLSTTEIDDVDAMLLMLIRVAFPPLYAELPAWRSRVLNGHDGVVDLSSDGIRYRSLDWQPLVDVAPSDARTEAAALLRELFPKLPTGEAQSMPPTMPRRIAHNDYFDRYFAMGIPSHDISDQAVQDAMSAAIAGDASALRDLLSGTDSAKTYLVLTKVRTQSNDLTDVERLRLVRVLAGHADVMSSRSTVVVDPYATLTDWMGTVLASSDSARAPGAVADALEPAELRTRLIVWRGVISLVGDSSGSDWVGASTKVLADQARLAFMASLRAKDAAPETEPVGFYRSFATVFGDAGELKAEIGVALRAGDAGLDDLAARMVGLRAAAPAGASWFLADFDQRAWNMLAPDLDDPWYDQDPVPDVDVSVTSWPNRKLYCQGRVDRPNSASSTDLDFD